MGYIFSLKLHNFRCYEQEVLEGVSPKFVILSGANGAGKTNILEAVSFLSAGRGLRGVKATEVQNVHHVDPWRVAAEVQTGFVPVRVGTGLDPQTGRRIVRIQGETVKRHNALSDHLSCVWLTPQMDRLFLDSAQGRRRFLDRLVFTFDPGHSSLISKYRYIRAQRSQVLKRGGESSWISGLEAQMAETGVAIAAARLDFTARLQNAYHDYGAESSFPKALLSVKGMLEDALETMPALDVEDLFRAQLFESRGVDMLTGTTSVGPHKSDLAVLYEKKNMAAAQCSTGEQKALLIGIILAHASLMRAEQGQTPILLMDEIAAHLDEHRRDALYDILRSLGGQVWMTGTDESLFSSLQSEAQIFQVQEGSVCLRTKAARAVLRAV